MYGHHIQQSMDQPGKVANPARGQLNRENNIPLSQCVPENLVSRDGFSRPVPRQPAHLHTQAESGAYLRDSSRVPRRRPYETAIRHRVSPVPRFAFGTLYLYLITRQVPRGFSPCSSRARALRQWLPSPDSPNSQPKTRKPAVGRCKKRPFSK